VSEPKGPSSSSITCPDCGAPNEPGAVVCKECNHPLTPVAEPGIPAHGGPRHAPKHPVSDEHPPRKKRPERPERVDPNVTTWGYRPPRAAQGSMPSWLWLAIGLFAIGAVLVSAIQIARTPKPVVIPNATKPMQTEADSLRKVLARDSTQFAANVALGNIYYDTGNYDGAIPFYERALRVNPAVNDVRVDLAVCYHSVGNSEHAVHLLEQVTAVDTTHAIAFFDLGIIYQSMGRKDEAIAMLTRAKTLEGPPQMKHVIDQLVGQMEGRAPMQAPPIPEGQEGQLPEGHPPIESMPPGK
jgi:hypothetical protein